MQRIKKSKNRWSKNAKGELTRKYNRIWAWGEALISSILNEATYKVQEVTRPPKDSWFKYEAKFYWKGEEIHKDHYIIEPTKEMLQNTLETILRETNVGEAIIKKEWEHKEKLEKLYGLNQSYNKSEAKEEEKKEVKEEGKRTQEEIEQLIKAEFEQ